MKAKITINELKFCYNPMCSDQQNCLRFKESGTNLFYSAGNGCLHYLNKFEYKIAKKRKLC